MEVSGNFDDIWEIHRMLHRTMKRRSRGVREVKRDADREGDGGYRRIYMKAVRGMTGDTGFYLFID